MSTHSLDRSSWQNQSMCFDDVSMDYPSQQTTESHKRDLADLDAAYQQPKQPRADACQTSNESCSNLNNLWRRKLTIIEE